MIERIYQSPDGTYYAITREPDWLIISIAAFCVLSILAPIAIALILLL